MNKQHIKTVLSMFKVFGISFFSNEGCAVNSETHFIVTFAIIHRHIYNSIIYSTFHLSDEE